jgi:large subunit ribosomal protein L17
MRHKNKGRKLGRTASHRKALLRNLAIELLRHKEIKTTVAKAKEARVYVERLITYAKKGELHHRRLAFAFLRDKESVKNLFDEIAPTFSDRPGGYTRIIKLGRRQGDGAPLALIQLVGFGEADAPAKPKKAAQKKAAPKVTEAVPEAEVVETKQPEVAQTETAPAEPESKPEASAEEKKED